VYGFFVNLTRFLFSTFDPGELRVDLMSAKIYHFVEQTKKENLTNEKFYFLNLELDKPIEEPFPKLKMLKGPELSASLKLLIFNKIFVFCHQEIGLLITHVISRILYATHDKILEDFTDELFTTRNSKQLMDAHAQEFNYSHTYFARFFMHDFKKQLEIIFKSEIEFKFFPSDPKVETNADPKVKNDFEIGNQAGYDSFVSELKSFLDLVNNE